MSDWEPTKWWRAIGPDGRLWCESSSEKEVRERARPGDVVEQLWARKDYEWRQLLPSRTTSTGMEDKN